jgi:hypothetical protein
MPKSHPPAIPVPPAPLQADEAGTIKRIVGRFYGADAIIRNWGPDPTSLLLHVETKLDRDELARQNCLAVLFTRIDRKQIDLVVTRRGWSPAGLAKIAHRQGEVI